MKKSIASAVFIISFLLCITGNTYGQEKTKDDLLRKSKRQITTGSILVGGGAIASTAGIFMLLNEKTFDAAPTFIITGLLIAVVGTPFYVVGQINRHKANRMSFKNEPIHIPKYAGNLPRSVPSITYSIPLN
jgi:archaellum biogenesis protein FlaJ (TadC family)